MERIDARLEGTRFNWETRCVRGLAKTKPRFGQAPAVMMAMTLGQTHAGCAKRSLLGAVPYRDTGRVCPPNDSASRKGRPPANRIPRPIPE